MGKKLYSKPQLYMESFEVAEFIAGNCGIVLNHTTEVVCSGKSDLLGDIVIFHTNICTESIDNLGETCYHANLGDEFKILMS